MPRSIMYLTENEANILRKLIRVQKGKRQNTTSRPDQEQSRRDHDPPAANDVALFSNETFSTGGQSPQTRLEMRPVDLLENELGTSEADDMVWYKPTIFKKLANDEAPDPDNPSRGTESIAAWAGRVRANQDIDTVRNISGMPMMADMTFVYWKTHQGYRCTFGIEADQWGALESGETLTKDGSAEMMRYQAATPQGTSTQITTVFSEKVEDVYDDHFLQSGDELDSNQSLIGMRFAYGRWWLRYTKCTLIGSV